LASERTSIKKAREAILEGILKSGECAIVDDAVFERLTSVRIRVPPATAVATALAPSVLIVSKMKLGHGY